MKSKLHVHPKVIKVTIIFISKQHSDCSSACAASAEDSVLWRRRASFHALVKASTPRA